MQTRFLSPQSLWIEMPLSAQTPRLVWRAMAACDLRRGKIDLNGASSSPSTLWVEGRSAPGLLSDNARVQICLTAHQNGTRLDFDTINVQHEIDFGAARKFQRRLMIRIEEFLRAASADWKEEPLSDAPPLSSPTDFLMRPQWSEAVFEGVIPIRDSRLSSAQKFLLWARVLALMVAVLEWGWPGLNAVFWALALWTLWIGRKSKKMDWFSFALFVGLGLRHWWPLLAP